MPQNSDWFQILPTTERSSDTLARLHSYETVDNLAESLPPLAAVLDVGAGASSLCSVVARKRPDIR